MIKESIFYSGPVYFNKTFYYKKYNGIETFISSKNILYLHIKKYKNGNESSYTIIINLYLDNKSIFRIGCARLNVCISDSNISTEDFLKCYGINLLKN